MLRIIYSGVQIPDISFEPMRALSALSGVAFDRLMIDAHLRIKDYQDGIRGEGVQRRINFLASASAAITSGAREQALSLEITPQFGLFRIHDDTEHITNAKLANGSKSVMTRRKSVTYVRSSNDANATADQLQEEVELTLQQVRDNKKEAK